MAINAFPIATVPPAANLIANTPFGIITATDVQAALNQLAGAIPSPGSGTDPLFLIHGESISVTDPAVDANPGNRYGLLVDIVTNSVNSDPSFANTQACLFQLNVLHGQNTYNIKTQAKESFFATANSVTSVGAGQRFVQANSVTGYGMGDIAIYGNQSVVFAGGPTAGDEGQGWQLNSLLTQQNFLSQTTIFSVPTPSTLNTTTTQAILKSQFAQTVTVASTAGASAGHWIVVDQELPSDQTNMESVKIISVGPGTITAIFRANHDNGCTLKPALLLVLNSHFTLGQDRILVNWTQPSYSVGNIASITGGGFAGAGGANWTVNMVGGNALNIGAITLPSDDYPSTPFTALNPLKAVYAIKQLVSPTSLALLSTTVAADASYRGFGPGPSGRGAANQAYKIVPCAKILRIAEGMVICENSTSTWTVGDSVEQVICPYPDVTGYLYDIKCWSPGGSYRSFLHVINTGARKFDAFISLESRGGVTATGGDNLEWGAILSISSLCTTLIDANQSQCTGPAISLPFLGSSASTTDLSGAINWGPKKIQPNSVENGIDIVGGTATFTVSGRNTPKNPLTDIDCISYTGFFHLFGTGAVSRPMIMLDNQAATSTDYSRAKFAYDGSSGATGQQSFGLATEKLGTGPSLDITLTTNGVEQLRCISGDIIEISNPASFAANGSVATALTSLGPAGSHTTVQKWLKFKDSGNNTLYIPCF